MAPVDEIEQPTTVDTVVDEPAAAPVVEQSAAEALHCARTLAQNGEVDEAVEVLRCECSQAPAEQLSLAYQAVVEAHLRMERLDAAFALLSELQQTGRCVVAATCQEMVLLGLVQTHQHGRASELLRSMCGAGMAPGCGVFNSVVDAAVRARAYGEAWDVLELLLSHQRRADKYFVSILTKSLEASNDRKWVKRGISLVDKFIEQQKEDVDEIVFNSLLNVLGHVGDMLKLQQTLNRMSEYNVLPSAVTYGTVVKAYGRARDIDAVLKVWGDMRSRCLGVNPVTCGCVLDACVKCGHTDKAMAIFQEMRLSGLHKNTVLYATLIKGLAKSRDLMGALHLYQEMRMEGVPCNLVTFNSLMDVCVRCGDLATAALFLQDMISIGLHPDLITFSTLIKGYAHTGEVYKAMALSEELKSRGLKCDEIMYNSLIDGCAKANKLEEGLKVFADMIQSRVAPSNITFSILVKLYFEAGRAAEGFRMVEEMSSRYRCMPSRIVYTVLLRCCGQQGGPALARGAAMLTELASKRNSKLPDQGMVSAVVSGCIQHLDFDLAGHVVREFSAGTNAKRGSTGLVHVDCLRSLLEALGAYDEPRGQELLEFLRRKSLPASHISQLQAALVDGRRNGCTSVGQSGSTLASGEENATHVDSYSQWQHSNAYAQPYATDYYQQYNMGYQPQYAQQMGQVYYNQGYQQQQPQVQMPMYPAMPQQLQLPMMQQQLPMMQQPMLQMPGTMPAVPGSEFLVAPVADAAQAHLAAGLLPSTALPAPAEVPAVPAAAPAPAPTAAPLAPAPLGAHQGGAEKKAARRTVADKENAAPRVQQTKENDVLKQQPNNAMQVMGQRQAI